MHRVRTPDTTGSRESAHAHAIATRASRLGTCARARRENTERLEFGILFRDLAVLRRRYTRTLICALINVI